MAIDLNSLRSDLKREREGDWIEIPDLPGVEYCVRSNNYQPFQDAWNALIARNNKRYGIGRAVPQDAWGRDFGALLAEHLLLGWKGFDVEYSEDDALMRLTAEEWRILRETVLWASQQVGQAQIEFVEDAGKNSARSSAGSLKAAATPPTGSQS